MWQPAILFSISRYAFSCAGMAQLTVVQLQFGVSSRKGKDLMNVCYMNMQSLNLKTTLNGGQSQNVTGISQRQMFRICPINVKQTLPA